MKHKEQIFKLRSEGKSYREIQEILGCSKGTIAYHLGSGQKEKTRDNQRKHRTFIKAYIQEYKQSRGCMDCKEDYPYWMLDLDHIRDKEYNISRAARHTSDIEKIKIEIEKCEVVCSNCHRVRTYSRSVTSGTSTMDIESFYK